MSSDEADTNPQLQLEPAVYARRFGSGEFPGELNRFSWGAFLLPFFWGFAHRSWPVLSAWVVGSMSPLLLAGLFDIVGDNPLVTNLIAAEVVSEVIGGAARLWAGAYAYRLLWSREALLTELGRSTRQETVGEFLRRQKTWTLVGAGAMSAVSIGMVPAAMKFWGEYGLSYVGAAMSLIWLVAEVLLGLWLGRQMSSERPDEAPAS